MKKKSFSETKKRFLWNKEKCNEHQLRASNIIFIIHFYILYQDMLIFWFKLHVCLCSVNFCRCFLGGEIKTSYSVSYCIVGTDFISFWFKKPPVQSFVSGVNYILKRSLLNTCKTREISWTYLWWLVGSLSAHATAGPRRELLCQVRTGRIGTPVLESGQRGSIS